MRQAGRLSKSGANTSSVEGWPGMSSNILEVHCFKMFHPPRLKCKIAFSHGCQNAAMSVLFGVGLQSISSTW